MCLDKHSVTQCSYFVHLHICKLTLLLSSHCLTQCDLKYTVLHPVQYFQTHQSTLFIKHTFYTVLSDKHSVTQCSYFVHLYIYIVVIIKLFKTVWFEVNSLTLSTIFSNSLIKILLTIHCVTKCVKTNTVSVFIFCTFLHWHCFHHHTVWHSVIWSTHFYTLYNVFKLTT